MKRIALLFLAIFCLIIALASCSGNPHEHAVSYTEGDPPSCDAPGWERDCCECGAWLGDEREIPALGHEYIETVDHGTEPTCTSVGYTPLLYCKHCNQPDYDSREEIPKLDHDLEFPCFPICLECGFYYATLAVDHVYDNDYDDRCNVCESPRVAEDCPHENIEVIEAEQPATCEEDGYTQHSYCNDCKSDIYPTVLKKLGHEWDEGNVTTQPTCISEGVKEYNCVRGCKRTEPVGLGDHEYNSDDVCTVCSIHASTLELKYTSNGDGTCSVTKGSCTRSKMVIPEISPSGDRVVAIGDSAFCDTATTVVIPASVTSISASAFSSFKGSFEVSDESTSYKDVDGSLYSYDGKTLERYKYLNGDSADIPEGVNVINAYALSHQAIATVAIPESVTYIGEMAFAYSKIGSFNFYAKDVTYIADNAFTQIWNTRSVSIKSIEDWLNLPMGSGPLVGSSAVKMYCDGNGIGSLVIPKTVKSVRQGAFYGCDNLYNVKFEEGSQCTSIGNSAFSNCEYLGSVDLPYGLTSVGEYAFGDCKSLTSVVLPYGLTDIGEYAFYSCTALKSILIPFGVWTIHARTFDGCTSLTDVYYTGRKEEWEMIDFGSLNDALTNATIHYEYVPEPSE